LEDLNLLKKDTDISFAPAHPTTCGVDGSYTIEKLLSTDMIAIAGVAVEGLTPPSEIRYWPNPHHLSQVLTTSHNEANSLISRAIMMCMELELAANAPHDVIFLDGSLATPFIFIRQALFRMREFTGELSSIFLKTLENALESYEDILLSKRTDKMFVGVPKYTTKKEISEKIAFNNYEDRGLLSFVLNAGEFIEPVEMHQETGKLEIPSEMTDRKPNLENLSQRLITELKNLFVIYYRPFTHFPTLRLEISPSIAKNNQRIAILFEALKLQCGAPGILEPYPLYLADRMVKHLRVALPAIRKTATQEMSLKWDNELGNIYLAMHGYRTDWGK
jgi:hypothetical protein